VFVLNNGDDLGRVSPFATSWDRDSLVPREARSLALGEEVFVGSFTIKAAPESTFDNEPLVLLLFFFVEVTTEIAFRDDACMLLLLLVCLDSSPEELLSVE